MLLLKIKEVHGMLRERYPGLDFLSELKGLEQVYALVSARIQHIKKRFRVFEFFERMRVSVFLNHNALVRGVTDEVQEAVERAKRLIAEFNTHFDRLGEVIAEVGVKLS